MNREQSWLFDAEHYDFWNKTGYSPQKSEAVIEAQAKLIAETEKSVKLSAYG